jgi:hypothetical protein
MSKHETPTPTTDLALQPSTEPTDVVTLDRIAREIAANIAASIDEFYPGALNERALFNVKAWARGEVTRWFGPPERGAPDMDSRLRASGAHRRHIKRLRTLAGTVQPGDAIEPILEVMDASDAQARLDYRAGGPVIEGDPS